jgi:hypothetical protein
MEPVTIAAILAVGLAARWVIRAWPREGGGYELASRDAQIQRLREEVDALNAEVRRLGESQSFMVRLLEGGTPPAGTAPGTPEPDGPNPETT